MSLARVAASFVAGCVIGLALLVWLDPAKPDCKALTIRADISARAAELCTGEIMACQMTFEQVQSVLADRQRANEACQ